MNKSYEYDEDLDILYIHNNSLNQKVSENLVVGNIVIDLAEDGKVLGVEIDSASKFSKLPVEQLKNLKVAKVELMRFGGMITLGIILASLIKEYTFQFAISKEANKMPIVAY